MSDTTYALRVIVAREPGYSPTIVGGVADTTWEVVPPEEWDGMKRELCEKWLGPDWTAYDITEAVLHVPLAALEGLFSPPITVERVEAIDA